MEHRRRDDGGPVRGASAGDGGQDAGHRAVRLRSLEPARSDPGTGRQAHELRLACDAARSRHRRARLRELEDGVLRADHRDLGALLPEHDAQKHPRAARLYGPRVRAGAGQHARRRHLHGRVQRRAGDVQPLRLPHADPEPVLRRLGRALRRGLARMRAARTIHGFYGAKGRTRDRHILSLLRIWRITNDAMRLIAHLPRELAARLFTSPPEPGPALVSGGLVRHRRITMRPSDASTVPITHRLRYDPRATRYLSSRSRSQCRNAKRCLPSSQQVLLW